jgi:hypothetical protein
VAEPGKHDAPDQDDAGDRNAQVGRYTERTGDRIARLEDQAERMTRALELLAQRAAAPRRDWDAVAALVATFIGALALAISGYTAHVQRQQLRAQVWPRMAIASSDPGREIFVDNNGTGPGRVIAARVTIDGATVSRWSDARTAVGYTTEGVVRSTIHNAVLPPGKRLELVKSTDDDASRTKFLELLPGSEHGVTIMLCYCSVLDDCWIAYYGRYTRLDGFAIAPDECPIEDDERFKE